MRPGDIAIIVAGAALVFGTGIGVYSDSRVETLRITQGNHDHRDFPAWQNRHIRVDGPLGETVVEVKDGRARVLRSPCTGKLCIRSGWLGSAGDAAACLPNRVSLALLGNDTPYDAVAF